jgi:hypothetical protein
MSARERKTTLIERPRQAAGQWHANAEARDLIARFLAAKSGGDLEGALVCVSPDAPVFADVTLGWELTGRESLRDAWGRHIPSWGPGPFSLECVLGEIRSGWGSVMLLMTSTLPAFRAHMKVTSSVDVRNGKITRWVDYWDGVSLDSDLYNRLRSIRLGRPHAIRSETSCSGRAIREIAARLVDLLSRGDAQASSELFAIDGSYEECGLGSKLRGRAVIARYLERVVGAIPLGRKSRLGHVVGGQLGGGFEWVASADSPVSTGATALRLNTDGLIAAASVVYDTRDLPDCYRDALQAQASDSLH